MGLCFLIIFESYENIRIYDYLKHFRMHFMRLLALVHMPVITKSLRNLLLCDVLQLLCSL